MTKEQYIRREMDTWGEDYIFDLIDRGYEAVELVMNGKLRWWWVLTTNEPLTQASVCATLVESP